MAQRMRLIDLMPTVLDSLAIPIPDRVQGQSLVGWLQGADDVEPLTAFAEGVKIGHEQKALYGGAWKLMVTPDKNARLLYHIHADPAEMNDLASDRQGIAQDLHDLLDRIECYHRAQQKKPEHGNAEDDLGCHPHRDQHTPATDVGANGGGAGLRLRQLLPCVRPLFQVIR